MGLFHKNGAREIPPSQEDALPKIDAQIHVSVANGGLSAILLLEPPENGGLPPTLEALEKALAEAGVVFGIDRETLKRVAGQPAYHMEIPAASGIEPINGDDGTITYQFETGEKELRPKMKEDGQVDYKELELANNVRAGQVLCLITPPTEGTPGTSVRGETLSQKKGKPFPVFSCLGKNTLLREDGAAILSKIDGQAELVGPKVSVGETLFIRGDVDLSTGNIKAVGNVTVYGMIQPGFSVEAEGNVDVFGTVDSAIIRAGGSVRLSSGINGSELNCGGDLKSRFIESCKVSVRGDIRAEYVLHSSIRCGKSLKTEGSISKIIGGTCMVLQNIESRNIGSSANVKTILQLGTDPTVLQRQQELQELIPSLEKQLESLTPLLSLLRRLESENRLLPEKQELLQKISGSYDAAETQLQSARGELEDISETLLNKGFSRVICPGAIYPGTKVTIGTASLIVTDVLNNTSLSCKDSEIVRGPAR